MAARKETDYGSIVRGIPSAGAKGTVIALSRLANSELAKALTMFDHPAYFGEQLGGFNPDKSGNHRPCVHRRVHAPLRYRLSGTTAAP